MSPPAARSPVRVAVIGCGAIAYWAHLRTLRRLRGAALVAAADPDPAARARAEALVRGPVHACARDVLESDVDAVVVSVPTAQHAEVAAAAARAGKHIYVEKPLAATAGEARTVVDAVSHSNVHAAVGFNFRHHPCHERGRALLKANRIGAVRAVQTVFCEPLPAAGMPEWKRRRTSGGGALLDLASHHIDQLRWCLDDDVASVEARIASTRTEHDSASLAIEMRGGASVQMFVSYCAGPADFLEFIGERGTLRIDRYALAPVLTEPRRTGYGSRTRFLWPTKQSAALGVRRLGQPAYEASFRRALAAFIRRIEGQRVDLATIEDGERSLRVVLAAEESAERRVRVSLP
jgi:myo-inositol 2-dehydrogenase/D-chiro-inositol 1-dehydrogenase